ncbi:atlastin-2-like isoform X1 [Haemaphysalis longicornis]
MDRMGSGRPVQIFRPRRSGGFHLDESALEVILKNDRIQNKPIAVISVAGEYRSGKSFLLNLFIQYMSSEDQINWMANVDAVFEGFSCRGGSELDTCGIWLWSEVFLVPRPENEVAVLFMDTQGVFDCTTSPKDGATIFTLGALLSSVLVYNIMRNIGEDHLQYLSHWLDYGNMAQEKLGNTEKFQKLVFLVRDWEFKDLPLGEEGGRQLLDRLLQFTKNQSTELKRVRQHLRSCVSDNRGFLLPRPGKKVATGESRDFSDMEDDFKNYLHKLIAFLLVPQNLVTKKINGREITCSDWANLCPKFHEIFSGDQLPEPVVVSEVFARVANDRALHEAEMIHENGLKEFCGIGSPYRKMSDLQEEHSRLCKDAEQHLASTMSRFGNFGQEYKEQLQAAMETCFEEYVKINRQKLPFLTPGVLVLLVLVTWMLVWPVSIIARLTKYMEFLLAMDVFVGVFTPPLIFWVWSKYTGKMAFLREGLESIVLKLLELCPCLHTRLRSLAILLYDKISSAGRQWLMNSLPGPTHSSNGGLPV